MKSQQPTPYPTTGVGRNKRGQVQLIQADETIMEIDATYFQTIYEPSSYTLTVTIHDMKAAIGKYLEQNEKIKIIFYMEYALIGSMLPEEFA